MLKGFVSGEEKDIVKIPMRGKNLANLYDVDKTYLGLHYTTGDNMMIVINGTKGSGANVHTLVYPNILLHAGIYTVKVKMVSGSITNITDGLFFGINRNTYGQQTTPGVKQIGDVGERTFTLDSDTLLTSLDIAPSYASEGSIWDNATFECWLYSGSDDIPYEPYGYQNGWEIRDNQDRLIWGREDELQTTTGTLPFKGYNLPVKVKSLLGNAVQNGTPSPDNTIVPEMCGVRTGNLTPFPYSSSGVGTTEIDGITWTVAPNGAIKGTGMTTKGTNFYFQNRNHNFKLKAGTYTISIHGVHEGMNLLFRDIDASITITTIGSSMNIYTFTLDSDTGMCALYFNTGSSDISVNIDCTVMLNSGSTALPYEPYGYKIPFTNAGRTISVYLGQTQTYRAIDSVKLKDLRWEDFDLSGTTVFRMATNLPKRYGSGISTMLCTNYIVVIDRFSVTNNTIAPYNTTSSNRLIVRDDRYTTAADWVAALSDEAVVYYVLAEPEIGIVNEPLAKIGDYADELTTIQVHGLSAPLYGIGDYKDILNLATGVVTRNIKKLVLTGEENFGNYNNSVSGVGLTLVLSDMLYNSRTNGVCSHFLSQYSAYESEIDGITFGANSQTLIITFSVATVSQYNLSDLTSKINYIKSQYAAGTPVTIWYILETPETETVTVPTGMTGEIKGYLTQISTPTPTNQSIPKWNGEEETGGTYAVTVYTPPEIPTTTGQNTLTVETEKIHGLTNPLCGIGDYKDVLNLSTGIITRNIKKLVLTGEEGWLLAGSDVFYLESVSPDYRRAAGEVTCICSHFPASKQVSSAAYVEMNTITFGSSVYSQRLYCSYTDVSTITDFKSYLQQQYAAGTPVTIWYVLEIPETETITVPYGLECSVEGYLTQSGTPTPSTPITPDSNGILESDETYAVEVSLIPSNLTVKGHIKPVII